LVRASNAACLPRDVAQEKAAAFSCFWIDGGTVPGQELHRMPFRIALDRQADNVAF